MFEILLSTPLVYLVLSFLIKFSLLFKRKEKRKKKSMLKPIKTTKGWKVVMFAVVVGIVLGVEVVVVVQSWREEGVGGCSNTE